MKRLFGVLVLVGTVLLSAGLVFAAPTKSLVPGPITSLPATITVPGYYYLTGNLMSSNTSSDGIVISTTDVTIDLMGFSILGPSGSPNLAIVGINSTGEGNIEVRNGTLEGWWTGFKGRAFCRALNIRVKDCQNGIDIELNGLVKDCVCNGYGDAFGNGFGIHNVNGGVTTGNIVVFFPDGISGVGTTISNNTVQNCTRNGINGDSTTIISNTVRAPSNSVGIATDNVCLVTQNTVFGETSTPYNLSGDTVSVNNAPPSPQP
jgi:hypothetical protein